MKINKDEDFTGEGMSCKLEDSSLVIRLPLDFLAWTQKQRDETIIVTDMDKMGEYLARDFMEFGLNQDTGGTAFEELIDECFMDALESAEDWLLGWFEIEDEEEG